MPHYKQEQITSDKPNLAVTVNTKVAEKFTVQTIRNINSGIHFSFIVDGILDANIALDVSTMKSYFDVIQIIDALTKSLPLMRKYNQHVLLILNREHFERFTGRTIQVQS